MGEIIVAPQNGVPPWVPLAGLAVGLVALASAGRSEISRLRLA
jgi:hypothetical protein